MSRFDEWNEERAGSERDVTLGYECLVIMRMVVVGLSIGSAFVAVTHALGIRTM